ncbi:hypothetical protein ADIAL_0600 [Alkalibacterium sp. AK22]|nr:hypothetical protein ADIAL_0600 [Alkalibacterium sp. AK22]
MQDTLQRAKQEKETFQRLFLAKRPSLVIVLASDGDPAKAQLN